MLAGMAGAIELRWARGEGDVRTAFEIRDRVFCVEQGVPRDEEIDALDEHALHLLAVERDEAGDRALGTLRLLLEGERARIGRVAVEADERHRGVASRMLELALARAGDEGVVHVRLASQIVAAPLYERAGFVVESEPFDDAGIPHVWMARSLAPPPPGG
jgi:predicted GNAT family N-acyltransferase